MEFCEPWLGSLLLLVPLVNSIATPVSTADSKSTTRFSFPQKPSYTAIDSIDSIAVLLCLLLFVCSPVYYLSNPHLHGTPQAPYTAKSSFAVYVPFPRRPSLTSFSILGLWYLSSTPLSISLRLSVLRSTSVSLTPLYDLDWITDKIGQASVLSVIIFWFGKSPIRAYQFLPFGLCLF